MPDPKAAEDLDLRRRRLRYRASHRGMLEMDLIMGGFAEAFAGNWDHTELDRFETLMEEQDADLFKWVLGQEAPPVSVDAGLIAELAEFQKKRTSSK